MTLIEVLVVIVVWGLFTTMVATALVMAYHDFHGLDDRLQSYRKASVVLDRLMRQLALCRQFDAPSLGPSAGAVPMTVYPPTAAAWKQVPWVAPDVPPTGLPGASPTLDAPLAFQYQTLSLSPTPTWVGVGYALEGNTLMQGSYGTTSLTGPMIYSGISNWRVVAPDIQTFLVVAEDPQFNQGWHFLSVEMDVQTFDSQPLPLVNHVPLQSVTTPL